MLLQRGARHGEEVKLAGQQKLTTLLDSTCQYLFGDRRLVTQSQGHPQASTEQLVPSLTTTLLLIQLCRLLSHPFYDASAQMILYVPSCRPIFYGRR